MITAVSISGGATYLAKHLSANDYYAEGEKVEGEWVGKGAQALGLEGVVEAEQFEGPTEQPQPGHGEEAHRAQARCRQGHQPEDRQARGARADLAT